MNYIKISELDMNESKMSPFAVYPGEKLSVREVPTPRSMYITDIDKTILIVLNKYLLLSSRLIFQALKNAGMENVEQKDLQHRLRWLTDAAFVQSASFKNEDASYSASRVYSVAYRGRGYLKSIGVQPRLGGYIATLDSLGVKRFLSVNQYLIETRKDYHTTEVGSTVFVPTPKKNRPDKIFRAYGMVQESDTTVIADAVRRGDDWRLHMLERLDRMSATLKSKECNTKLQRKIQVVLLAENNQHLKEIDVLLYNKRYCFEILLSTDLLVYSQPTHCLVARTHKSKNLFRSFFEAACY